MQAIAAGERWGEDDDEEGEEEGGGEGMGVGGRGMGGLEGLREEATGVAGM